MILRKHDDHGTVKKVTQVKFTVLYNIRYIYIEDQHKAHTAKQSNVTIKLFVCDGLSQIQYI